MFHKRICHWMIAGVAILHAPSAHAEPFPTGFTFQAQLEQSGSPLNGSADCRFELFGVNEDGMPVAPSFSVIDLAVIDGLVTVQLDFGVDVFDGSSRWLEVSIRSPHDPTDTAPFTTLSPRQSVSPIPYALQTRGIFVDGNGQVSIGTGPVFAAKSKRGPIPESKLRVLAEEKGATALLAEATSTTGAAVGMKGTTASTAGRGVEGIGPAEGIKGQATAVSGLAIGVKGTSDSTGGTGVAGQAPSEGVRGDATATSGIARGVCGVSASTSGEGVLGHASAVSGNSTGVKGLSDSPSGAGVVGQAVGNGIGVKGQAVTEGVRGEATAGSGTARGVCGITGSTTGEGVRGEATVAGGTGVVGQAASEGVRGVSTATTGTAQGVCGISPSTSGDGVFGHATAATGAADGVHGRTDSVAGRGVFGEATSNGTGVSGVAGGSGTGVRGETTGTNGVGVHGLAPAMSGDTTGVMGTSNSPTGRGVYGGAPNEGVRGELTGGSGSVYGILARSNGINVTGVYGETPSSSTDAYGVHGRSLSNAESSAGVVAEGAGADGPMCCPRAAALEVRNGAINVSGPARPAGTIAITGPWSETVESCSTVGPGSHFHKVAHTIELEINNDLIVPNSIILLTVEVGEVTESQHSAYIAHVYDKSTGHAMVRVTALTKYGGASCPPPIEGVSRSVHYLIINPLP